MGHPGHSSTLIQLLFIVILILFLLMLLELISYFLEINFCHFSIQFMRLLCSRTKLGWPLLIILLILVVLLWWPLLRSGEILIHLLLRMFIFKALLSDEIHLILRVVICLRLIYVSKVNNLLSKLTIILFRNTIVNSIDFLLNEEIVGNWLDWFIAFLECVLGLLAALLLFVWGQGFLLIVGHAD